MESTLEPRTNDLTVAAPGVEEVPRVIEDVLRRLGASAVFGEPIRSGDTLVVPVAEVRVGFGFGAGAGRNADRESGGGGGGGGGGKVVPRGYIQVTPQGAHFQSTLNVTALVLGGMGLAAAALFAVSRARR